MKNGRYGAYVTAGGVNATIPSDKDKDAITLAEAIALIDERAAKGGGKPKRSAKAKAAKPTKPVKTEVDATAPKQVKKAAVKKPVTKPKSQAVSKARAPVTATAKTSPSKAAKPVAKKSVGKASG
jgi:DNA topoisomerase-1